jgi:hypothetical protein
MIEDLTPGEKKIIKNFLNRKIEQYGEKRISNQEKHLTSGLIGEDSNIQSSLKKLVTTFNHNITKNSILIGGDGTGQHIVIHDIILEDLTKKKTLPLEELDAFMGKHQLYQFSFKEPLVTILKTIQELSFKKMIVISGETIKTDGHYKQRWVSLFILNEDGVSFSFNNIHFKTLNPYTTLLRQNAAYHYNPQIEKDLPKFISFPDLRKRMQFLTLKNFKSTLIKMLTHGISFEEGQKRNFQNNFNLGSFNATGISDLSEVL